MRSGCPPKPWRRRTCFGGFRRRHQRDHGCKAVGLHLLRRLGWNRYFLSDRRSTGGDRRCPSWTTGLITGLIIVLVVALPACTRPVLITGLLTSGPASMPSHLDYSRSVELAGRPGRFHPDGITVIARISETDAGTFVRAQFCCVAGCHQPTEIILA